MLAELTGKILYRFGLKYHIVSLLGGVCGYYSKVAMRRLDERRLYYEHKRKKKEQKKTSAKETFDSIRSDRMSLGVNDADPLDDSYISGAY